MEVKKSKRAAIENQRGTWLLMGFVVVLAFMFVTFEWTQHDIKVAKQMQCFWALMILKIRLK